MPDYPEPMAAARRVDFRQIELSDGEVILVIDIGCGTTDVVTLEYGKSERHGAEKSRRKKGARH